MEIKEKALQILQDDMNLKAVDEHGNSLLHQILLSGEAEEEVVELLQLLLNRGVDPNVKNARQKTALHLAVEKRMKDVVDLLIECGAREDVVDQYGISIAHHFVENEYFECKAALYEEPLTREKRKIEGANFAEFMISREFDFDRRNNHGQSALHWAATSRYLPLVLLARLEHASHIDFMGQHNTTLLHLVLAYGRSERHKHEMNYSSRRSKIVELLLDRGVPVEAVDELGRTALYTAIIREEDMRIVQAIGDRLLDACQDGDIATRLFHELVGTCASWSTSGIDYYLKMLHTLIVKGADVNVKAESGRSPIHCAAEDKTVGYPLSELLLGAGCDVNAEDEAGNSALHLAVLHHDNTSVIRLLIEFGCDVNAKDKRGNTALHVAARHLSKASVVRLLIESGAVVNCKNKCMEMPLHLAVKREDGGNFELAELLLENGANVNSKDADGRTALSHAASVQDMAVLRLLLKRGAYVKARDEHGMTALSWAVSYRSWASFEELLKYGADITDNDIDRFERCDFRCKGRNVLNQHLIKLKAARFRCCYKFNAFMSDEYYQKCYKECLKEIETLKATSIDSRTSIYDYLHKDIKGRCGYINNEKLQELVDSPVLGKQFPQYGALILASYREVTAKKLLLQRAKEALLELTEIDLPDICLEQILGYLSTEYWIDIADRDKSSA